MAGEEAAEGSRRGRRMDLTVYLGLPPLPRPPGRLDAALDCPASSPNPAVAAPALPDATAVDEPEALAAPAAAYSPSNALSTPEEEEQLVLDPIIDAWFSHNADGDEGTDPAEPAVELTTPPVNRAIALPRAVAAAGLQRNIPVWEGFARSVRVAGDGVQMVSSSALRQSLQGPADIEAGTPELRFQRLIQVTQQHNVVMRSGSGSGSVDRSQRSTSPETDRLVSAIQCSHNSLDAARRQKVDGDDKLRGNKKDMSCGCNSNYECNVCLDTAKDPVVTPCGHLFCWPCLYQWLHGHSPFSECPVCKGEVLEATVTPIYGRGGEEQGSASPDMPRRPCAKRKDSLRQQLQTADARGIASVVRQLIDNQGIIRSQPNRNRNVGVEVTVVPAGRSRARARRQQRQNDNVPSSVPAVPPNATNAAPESGNQVSVQPSSADNVASTVPAAPPQSTSEPSASSTAAVVVGGPGSSRRARPSGTSGPRRTRRRQQ
ncbi:hypothetical protein ACP4OV_029383 [Aristida adscensionis]